ncbi:MAG: hypothetical protein ACRCXZ_08740 [Patescibacteria group bacterium]
MKKYFIILTILVFTFISFASLAQRSALSPSECDYWIRQLYNNQGYYRGAQVENVQRCLHDAGFWTRGNFTQNYGPETISQTEAYLNRASTSNNAEAKKKAEEEAAKKSAEEAAKKAEEERQKQEQIKAELLKKQQEAEAATNNSSQTPTTPDSTTNSENNQSSQTTPNQNNTSDGQSSTQPVTGQPVNEIASATPDRQPQTADRIIINAIYFLVALPFILFAISVLMAFLKVFKKGKQEVDY